MMDFYGCVAECAKAPDFVTEYDRLTGESLGRVMRPRAPIERMIDESTGFEREQWIKFGAFVWEFVWSRLPCEAFACDGAHE